jgi:predicted metal-dependent HD superfamily phosphohydrolase
MHENVFSPEKVPLVELRTQWLTALHALGADTAEAHAAFADLVACHAGPGRFYHNLAHIACVVCGVHAFRAEARDFSAMLLAAFFHDAVYDSRAKDNEEQSAAYAEEVLARLGVAAADIGVVQGLILKTKRHETDESDVDGRILLDCDLSILGERKTVYDHYARLIRQEYAWVPDDAYRTGRAALLRSFLDRPRIYHTERYVGREKRARRNLRREIAALTGDEPLGT